MSQVRILSPRPFSRRTATAASAPSFLVGLRARSGPVDRPLSETPVKLPARHAISLAEEGDLRLARRPHRIAVSRQAHAARRGPDRREKKAPGYPDIGLGMGKPLGRPRRSNDDTLDRTRDESGKRVDE